MQALLLRLSPDELTCSLFHGNGQGMYSIPTVVEVTMDANAEAGISGNSTA